MNSNHPSFPEGQSAIYPQGSINTLQNQNQSIDNNRSTSNINQQNISQQQLPNNLVYQEKSRSLGQMESIEGGGGSQDLDPSNDLITPTGISHQPHRMAAQLRPSHTIDEQQTIEELAHSRTNPQVMDYQAIRGKRGSKKQSKRQAFPIRVQTLNQEIIPRPGQRKKYVIHVKRPRIGSQASQHENQTQRQEKLLDGFMLLYSCRVKLPHQAVKSRLSGQNITAVEQVDLGYFQNLVYLDLSDNKVQMDQLQNLKALVDLNLQYNQINGISLPQGAFPKLQVLNLSFNRIPPSHISEFRVLRELQSLDLSANDLCTIPEQLSFFQNLTTFNLSSNQFTSQAFLVQPSKVFKALSSIPKLKKLNLARNKLNRLHLEEALHYYNTNQSQQQSHSNLQPPFHQLQDLDFSYNLVMQQEGLFQCVEFINLQFLNITGNPFAQAASGYKELETQLYTRVQAVVINYNAKSASGGGGTLLMKKYAGGGKVIHQQQQIMQYNFGNVMKISQMGQGAGGEGGMGDVSSKKQLGQAEMNKGIALPMADIGNEGREEGGEDLFPIGKGHEDIFTPPDKDSRRQQIQQKKKRRIGEKDADFFITGNQDQYDMNADQQDYAQEIEQQVDEMQDDIIDFGRQKMDNFKRICSNILLADSYGDYDQPMQLQQAYRSLKNVIKHPKTCHPYKANVGYMKMTFAAMRQQKRVSAKTPDMGQSTKKVFKKTTFSNQMSKMNYLEPPKQTSKSKLKLQNKSSQFSDSSRNSKKYISRQEKIDKKIKELVQQYRQRDTVPIYDSKRDKKKNFAFSDSQDDMNDNQKGDYLESDDGSDDWGIAQSHEGKL